MPLSDCSASSHSPSQSGGEVLRLRATSITDDGAAAATTRLQTAVGENEKTGRARHFPFCAPLHCKTIRRGGSGGGGGRGCWSSSSSSYVCVSAAVRSHRGLCPSYQRLLFQAEGNRPPPQRLAAPPRRRTSVLGLIA